MKRNDLVETKKLEIKAILEQVKQSRLELQNLSLEKSMNKLKNIKAVSRKRKDIAQMLTIVRQKQLLTNLEVTTDAKA